MDFTILHFAIHIVWRANVICTYRKSGIARKTTVAYPELRLVNKIEKDQNIVVGAFRSYYITSFSANEDNLSIWGMYAANGNGCAIAFDYDMLTLLSR